MGLKRIGYGEKAPEEFNVIIEIPMHGDPVKYEVDKESGVLFVDRFMSTPMYYPANYGYIPMTLSEDGDPVDVLVITPVPLISGVVIPSRVVGMLKMVDEAGIDTKLIAVPTSKRTPFYDDIVSYSDLPKQLLASIEHFFTHYKDLEKGKWVKIDGWADTNVAQAEILASIKRYNDENK